MTKQKETGGDVKNLSPEAQANQRNKLTGKTCLVVLIATISACLLPSCRKTVTPYYPPGVSSISLPNPTAESALQLYRRLPVRRITPDNLEDMDKTIAAAGTNGIIELVSIEADLLGNATYQRLDNWVKGGGTLWVRGNCSVEEFFGVTWHSGPQTTPINKLLCTYNKQIAPHPITDNVTQIRLISHGYYSLKKNEADRSTKPDSASGWRPILCHANGTLFAELRRGDGVIIFDTSTPNPTTKAPFYGIYGFDSGTFWFNFMTYYGKLAIAPPNIQPSNLTTNDQSLAAYSR